MDQATFSHLFSFVMREFPHASDEESALIVLEMSKTYETDPDHFGNNSWWHTYDETVACSQSLPHPRVLGGFRN